MSLQPQSLDPLAAEPGDAQRLLVYLAQSEGRTERRIIDRWLAERGAGQAPAAHQAIFYERPRDAPTSAGLVNALSSNANLDDEAWLAPVRVIWLAPKRSGVHMPRWRDALLGRNPLDPGERAKARLAQSHPDRWQIIEGEPARLADLRQRWQVLAGGEASASSDGPRDFARFVARQAELALERAEYRARGARYKVPRVYKEDVAGSPGFRRGIAQLAGELGRAEDSVRSQALKYLDELRTAHDPFVLDLAAKAFHKMYASGYGEVDVDPGEQGWRWQILLRQHRFEDRAVEIGLV